jgi:hypothetical protein
VISRTNGNGHHVAPIGPGATYVTAEDAIATVEFLARVGIVSEVVPDGRYFRLNIWPLPPKGTH